MTQNQTVLVKGKCHIGCPSILCILNQLKDKVSSVTVLVYQNAGCPFFKFLTIILFAAFPDLRI